MIPMAVELFAGLQPRLLGLARQGSPTGPMSSHRRGRWMLMGEATEPIACGSIPIDLVAIRSQQTKAAFLAARLPYADCLAGQALPYDAEQDRAVILQLMRLLGAFDPPACALVLVYPEPVSPCAFYPRRCRFDDALNGIGYPGRWSFLHAAGAAAMDGCERLVRLCRRVDA